MKRILGAIIWIYFIGLFLPVTILAAIIIIVSSSVLRIKNDGFYRWVARTWGKIAIRITFCPVEVINPEKAHTKEGCGVIISNHQSGFDIFAGTGFYPVDFLFMSKAEMFKKPLVGQAMKHLGYISVDRKNPTRAAQSIRESIRKIKEGYYVLIYPEGTRSQDSHIILPFKQGTIKVAAEGGIPIIPIVLHGTQQVKDPKKKFYVMPHKIKIQILDPVLPDHKLHPSNEHSGLTKQQQLEGLHQLVQDAYTKMDQDKKKNKSAL